MTSRSCLRLAAALALVGLFAAPASATPSFALAISTGGVSRLAVGETLQLRVYPPKVFHKVGEAPQPVPVPLRWTVVPKDAATVDAQGLLTAKQAGEILIRVEDARELAPKQLPAGTPGSRRLLLVPTLAGGRLPRLDGLAVFERFDVAWLKGRKDDAPRLRVGMGTLGWGMWMETVAIAPEPQALPWTFEAVKADSGFSDDGYRDLFGPGDFERYRDNLTKAKLVVTGWKDDVVRGRLEFETRRDVTAAFAFTAWLPDQHGLLQKSVDAR